MIAVMRLRATALVAILLRAPRHAGRRRRTRCWFLTSTARSARPSPTMSCARSMRPRRSDDRPDRPAHEHAGRPRFFDAPDRHRDSGLAGAGRHFRRAERSARGERRHLYRLCQRDRGHGARHQYRRRDADPARRQSAVSPGGGSDQKTQTHRHKPANRRTPRRAKSSTTRSPISAASPRVNGRNADWAEDAVRTAVSLPAAEALKLHVVDVVAADVPDLLRQIDGRTVTVAGKPMRLATAGLDVVTAPPDWRTELLALDHQSERCVHPHADRRLRADPRILQSGRRRAGPDRRHQSCGRALRAGAAADQLCRRRAGADRHRTDDRRSPYRRFRRASASAALPLSSSAR